MVNIVFFSAPMLFTLGRLGCFSIRIRMLFDREVDLDLFLFLTSSIYLHLVLWLMLDSSP